MPQKGSNKENNTMRQLLMCQYVNTYGTKNHNPLVK